MRYPMFKPPILHRFDHESFRRRLSKHLRRCAIAYLLLIVTAALGFTSEQLWQNGRGQLGIYGQDPFRSAFVDFSYRDHMSSKVDVQQFLIANTEPTRPY